MKLLKELSLGLFFGLLGLVAWTQIELSGEMLRVPPEQFTTQHYAYPILLLAAVLYLHGLFRDFLMPLSHLGREQREALKRQALSDYLTRSLAATVGLGYLLLIVYIVGFYGGLRDERVPNPAWPGVFFIAFGTLAQVRGVVRYLSGGSHEIVNAAAAPSGDPANTNDPTKSPSLS